MKNITITAASLLAATLAIPTVASASTVKVSAGDTLYSIAKKSNLSVNQLKTLNNLNTNTISPGQTLIVSQQNISSQSNSNVEYRTVTASVLNVRSGAGGNYGVIATIKKDTKVQILGNVNGWYHISVNNIKGYSSANYFSGPINEESQSPKPTTSNTSAPVTSPSINTQTPIGIYTVKTGDTLWGISKKLNIPVSTIQSLNHLTSNAVFFGQKLKLTKGTSIVTSPSQNSTNTTNTTNTNNTTTQSQTSLYYTVKSGDTLSKIANDHKTTVDYLKVLNPSIKNSSNISVGQIIKISNGAANLDPATVAKNVIAAGEKYLGVKYVYGASPDRTDEFDCSSFTQRAFSEGAGIPLPRTTFQQVLVGNTVPLNSLQPGDLLFFDPNLDGVLSHVGIYIGNNQMIDAETTNGVHISTLTQGYWLPRLVKAQRVIS